MASNDASSASMESTVRVLVSFFLATDETSRDNEDSSNNEEDAVEGVPVNFLSRTVRTRTGHITLSYRTLSSY